MTRIRALHVAVILLLALGASARAEQTRGPEAGSDRKGDEDRQKGGRNDKSRKKPEPAKPERPGNEEKPAQPVPTRTSDRGEAPAPVREPTADRGRERGQRKEPAPVREPTADRDRGRDGDARTGRERGTPPTVRAQDRLPRERQQQLVAQQEQRSARQRQVTARQQQGWQQQTVQLQRQRRTAQVRLREQYLRRRVQVAITIGRRPAYDQDPFFYTPAAYRYARGGRYYEVNQYGADLLRQAVNRGYEEGYRAGVADHADRWRPAYREHYAYQDGDFGYDGYYVDRDDYVFYFREGFRRGYEDGYGDRYVYGRYDDGAYRLQDSVMLQVLILLPLR